MIVYLSASYARRDEMAELRDELAAIGVQVIARWLDTANTEGMNRPELAQMDLEDINLCDALVTVNESVGSATPGSGGRHVEFGYALALGKRLYIVGEPENVFHHHPAVRPRSRASIVSTLRRAAQR